MPDRCAFCGNELPRGVHDRLWETMASRDGRRIAANYCRDGGEHERLAEHQPEAVDAYILHRRDADERWEA